MLPFRHPFTAIVSGPTGSNKTQFVMRLVDSADTLSPHRVRSYTISLNINHSSNTTRIASSFVTECRKRDAIDRLTDALVVYDDLMDEADERMTRLFTRGSHHRNVSVIFMVQNFFNKNRHMRTISLNAQYVVLFKNPGDSSQFIHLAKQLYPHNSRFAHKEYVNATKRPYGYILLDLRSDQDDDLRLRTNIFPGERQIVYVPK